MRRTGKKGKLDDWKTKVGSVWIRDKVEKIENKNVGQNKKKTEKKFMLWILG